MAKVVVTPSRQPTATWLSVVRAYNLCDAVMAARLAALGVRVVEHEVLAHLQRHPGLTQQELTARVFFAKSHLSALLGQMEAQGLVRRAADASDARVKRLSLTPAGTALAQRTMAVQNEIVATMTAGYPAAELARLEAMMNEVGARLGALLVTDAAAARAALSPRASAPRSRPGRPARRG